MTDKVGKFGRWLWSFFYNYMWLGVVIILAALLLDMDTQTKGFFLPVFIKLLESIGVAILVAAIFTYASGTSEFISKIKTLLEDIIIKRNFLGNIDPESKRAAIKSLVQPSSFEKDKYPNIANYYNFHIDNTLNITKKNVRSYYQVNCRVFFDDLKNKVAAESTYSYRLYPNTEGFSSINVGFEEDENGDSYCQYVCIGTQCGKREKYDNPELKQIEIGGEKAKFATIDINEIGKDKDRLDVELKVFEYGNDHWQLITFKALQPTDGFKFFLHCDENLTIRDYSIFIVGSMYYVDMSKEGKEISVTCNQWINEGAGMSILVAINNQNEMAQQAGQPDDGEQLPSSQV